jgi:hypothetical protein
MVGDQREATVWAAAWAAASHPGRDCADPAREAAEAVLAWRAFITPPAVEPVEPAAPPRIIPLAEAERIASVRTAAEVERVLWPAEEGD